MTNKIIMLILAAVTINLVINGGLFRYAGNAAAQTKVERDKEQDYTNVEGGLSYDDLIQKYAFYGEGEYPANGWKMAWTCTNDSWSNTYESSNLPQNGLTGDVIAKAYSKGTVTVEGEEKTAYHLIIEKGNGTGQMGAVILGSLEKSVKIAQSQLMDIDLRSYLLVAMRTIESNSAWQLEGIKDQITKVIIGDGVINVGSGAFKRCGNLTDVTIPITVTNIADSAFQYCTQLTTITYTGTKEQWNSITKGTDWGPTITKIDCSDGAMRWGMGGTSRP